MELLEKLSNNISNNMISVSQKIGGVLPPALLIVLNIFFFGPFNIYNGNASEFAVSLVSILYLYLLPALVLLTILTGIGLLLPNKLHRRYVAIIFVVGVLIWLQGNILVWKYGLLDGQGFDWTKGLWRGWIDSSLWLLLLFLGVVLYVRIYNVVMWGSIALISLQAVFVVFGSFQNTEIWEGKESAKSVSRPQEICEFSADQNIIQIILDGFQSDIFQEIIDEDPEHYFSVLDGFTFFRDTLGSFPTTYMSIPAILSGQVYRNDIPMPEFVNNVFDGKTIPNVLYNNGYEVDFILISGLYGKGQYSNKYIIPEPYDVTKKQYELTKSALMLDLILFRISPHFLKEYVYIDELGLIQRLSKQKEHMRLRHFAHKAFMQDLINNISVARKKSVYKLLHLCTTHSPFVVNEDCEYAGKRLPHTRENVRIQAKCSLDHLIEFFEELKSNGIYRSSFIIVNADTGAGKKVRMKNMDRHLEGRSVSLNEGFAKIVGAALPLLLVKPPYSKGLLRISRAHVALTDIPATLNAILGLDEQFTGNSIYEIGADEVRERKFYYYKWKHENWQDDYFNTLDEFVVKGSVFDRASWHLGSKYYSPKGLSNQAGKIDFGTSKSSRFKRFGWAGNERMSKKGFTFNWALGSAASILISLPKNKAVILTANIKSCRFSKPQHITVKADGKEIGSWELRAPWRLGKHSVIIPPDQHRPDVSIVEFMFSQHRIPKGGRDPRPLAVLFESITLSEVTNANQ